MPRSLSYCSTQGRRAKATGSFSRPSSPTRKAAGSPLVGERETGRKGEAAQVR